MISNYYDIIEHFNNAKTKEERKDVLLNTSSNFKQFLKFAFDPDIKFYVKKFPDDYIKPDTLPGIRYAGIESELRKTYLFQIGNETADTLTPEKRNQLLLQIIESFEPQEADLYIKMMQKNLKVKYLTYNLVKEIFPNLIP